MNLFKFLLTVFIVSYLIDSTFAQQRFSHPEKFSVLNGLPNNDVRCILKDTKGYIWVGTLYGLAKYDGNKFTVFRHQSGSNCISGDVITTIFEDKKGNIIVGANGLSLLERETGRWKNYMHDPNDPFSISNPGVSSIAQENDSIYWIITYNGVNRFNKNTGKFIRLDFRPNSRSFYSSIIEVVPEKRISFCISSVFYKYNFITDTFQIIPVKNNYEYNSIDVFNGSIIDINRSERGVYQVKMRNLALYKDSLLMGMEEGYHALFHDRENLFIVNNNSIYVFDRSFRLIDQIVLQSQTLKSKSGLEYFCGLKESNGTIWIGTSEGLYKIPHQSPFHIIDNNNDLPNNYIRSLVVDSNNCIWIGVKQGPIYKIPQVGCLTKNRISEIERINFPDKNGEVYATNQILQLKNGNLLFITQNAIYHYNTQRGKFTDRFQANSNGQYFSALEISGGVLIGSLEKPVLFKINILSDKIVKDPIFKMKNTPDVIYTIFKDCNNQIWIGGEGLYKLNFLKDFEKGTFEPVIPAVSEANLTNNSVWNIIEMDSTRLMVCTTTNGFYMYDKRNGSLQHFNKKNGLPTDFTCAIIKDHNQNYWMSTKEGLSFINLNDTSVTNYTIKNGPSNCDFNFKCCAKTNNNFLLFGSKQGIVFFHPDSIKPDTTKYPLMINEFRIFDDVVRWEVSDKDTIVLHHDQNFFSFEFSLLDYRNPREIGYKYQLLNYNKAERLMTDGSNSVSYTNVPPGKYHFQLTGYNPADSANFNQQKIDVVVIVKPAFYQTLLFKSTVILIIIVIIGVILLSYIRRQLLKGRLYKMELDLLRAQINPHFIFNTLTSIQHTILMNSKDVAVDYLSRFSRLIRMCLDYSRMEYISLEKALQFYITYVSVESVNLDETIDFQIQVDEAIDSNKIEISPMLIQPFIENAIVHGLSPKNKNMQLTLTINKAGSVLICTIGDNGIGRVKAAEIAQKKAHAHQSMGIEITRKSILLQMQSKNHIKDSVTITDNYDEKGNATGTLVCLKIPFREIC